MEWIMIFAGLMWFVWQLYKEKSWNTHAYDGKEIDYYKMFQDTNVNVTLGKMTKADVKRKWKSGEYVKK